MSKYNLGIIKTSIFNNLNESSLLKNFILLLKESDLLKIELSIYDNFEKKHIPNEDLAIKYIDENINLIKNKGFTKENFDLENKKFLPLIEGIKLNSSSKNELFENIHILIYESLNGKKSTNVNKLHDSFVYILEHIKNNEKRTLIESIELPIIPKEMVLNDFLLKKAIFEFNEKYNDLLSEDEILVLKTIINENKNSKEISFSTIKENTLNSLENEKTKININPNLDVNEKLEIENYISKINESIENIKNLEYKEETYINDIMDLVNLKTVLSN